MFRFSFSTLIGFCAGIGLLAFAVASATDNHVIFISLSSFGLVFGSTMAAALISYSTADVLHAMRGMLYTFFHPPTSQKHLKQVTRRFVEWSSIYRQGGIVALEQSLTKQENNDEFIRAGIDLMGAGYANHDVRTMLTDQMDATWQRHTLEGKVLNTMAVYSPGFGMVGTIVGLIIMLDNLNGDMAGLGKGLALALITTLYGVLLSNLFFKPAANQVTEKQETMYFRHQLISEGFVLLSEKRTALYMQDRLNAFIKPSVRDQALSGEL
ncbi:MAG: MotA/TolQ/ExbB proton channel family protein [Pseudomonadota bacterium]|nr:MotA/TolQ/ExbB proton channel family protein [Pseudomonadota bacterium]